jgi:hypothetical protein
MYRGGKCQFDTIDKHMMLCALKMVFLRGQWERERNVININKGE